MKYVCDACFDLFPSGSISDIPGSLLPTIPTVCNVCKSLVTPGIELAGHMVGDKLPWLPRLDFIPITPSLISGSIDPLSGSLSVSGSR